MKARVGVRDAVAQHQGRAVATFAERGSSRRSSAERLVAAILAAAALAVTARPALALTEGSVVDFVREQAAQKYQVPLKNVDVKWIGTPLAMIAPHLPDGAHLKLGELYTLSGTMPVPLQVWNKGRQVAMIFPELSIDIWEKVLVAKTYISMGTPLVPSELALERRKQDMLGSDSFTSMESVQGAVAMRDIPPGMVLTSGMAQVPPLVRSGTMVNVKLVAGGLTILTTGQAMQDGRRGQVIRVLNPTSQKDYMGVVKGSDEVDVDLEGGSE